MLAILAIGYVPISNAGLGPLLVLSTVFGFVLFYIQPFLSGGCCGVYTTGRPRLSYGFTYLGDFGFGALAASGAGAILTYSSATVLFAVLAVIAVLGGGFSTYLLSQGSKSD